MKKIAMKLVKVYFLVFFIAMATLVIPLSFAHANGIIEQARFNDNGVYAITSGGTYNVKQDVVGSIYIFA